MPKCSMAPPMLLHRRRNHITPVGDRGGAEYDDKLRTKIEQLPQSPKPTPASSCGTRRSAMIVPHPAGASLSAVTRRVFLHDLRRQPGQQGRDHADALDRCTARPACGIGFRPPWPRRASRSFASTPNGMSLHGGDHLAGRPPACKAGECCERDGFIDAVDVDRPQRGPPPARRPLPANRLARPVNARSTLTPSPAIATCAMLAAAATSSEIRHRLPAGPPQSPLTPALRSAHRLRRR